MLANIASIEIPPIFMTYLDWLKDQSEAHLRALRSIQPACMTGSSCPALLGEYFRDSFRSIVKEAESWVSG